MSTVPTDDEQLRADVRARYAKTALQVLGTEQATATDACCETTCCTPNTSATAESKTALPVVSAEPVQTAACCGSSCCSADTRDGGVITSDLYNQAELGETRWPPLWRRSGTHIQQHRQLDELSRLTRMDIRSACQTKSGRTISNVLIRFC